MSEQRQVNGPLPGILQVAADERWQAVASANSEFEPAADFVEEAKRVFALSEFVAQQCQRVAGLLVGLSQSGDLHRGYEPGEMGRRLAALLDGCSDERQLASLLRQFRQREMVRIAWRDLAGHADLVEVTADLSHLADAAVDQALSILYGWHCEQWGTPFDPTGNQQRLVVLGMGKLGAYELNFSSDIDLIFAYPEEGETQGGRRSTTNQEFFIRLGQRLIAALDAKSAEGFVFRVDMRLRPFGSSSPLAVCFDAMEGYYQSHGREWERYALIKARPIAGDLEQGEELLARLRPFIFRRYVDYGAFESLREMKAMISSEVKRKGMEDNVKLGAGGIREIEFIGQAFQLIRGGREKNLQQRRILTILEVLRGFDMLPEYVVDELTAAYIFLRDSEHRIQAYADQQTHMLPTDEAGRARLAYAMGFENWENYEEALRTIMAGVQAHFDQVFAAPQTEHAESDEADLTGLWLGTMGDEQAEATLTELGFDDPAMAVRQLTALREGRSYIGMSSTAKRRLDQLIPLLLGAVGSHTDAGQTLQRLLELIEGIGRRSAYYALLVENPMALSQLVRLCGGSPLIAHQLTRMPQLLDELLDPRSLYAPPERDALRNELWQRVGSAGDDLERQMDELRRFKQANGLRVAAADLVGAVPLMRVSDHLTDIAEEILNASLNLSWRHMVARHGRPQCGDERVCDTGFAVIAYGKLGGFELGYGSDLDIVFLHSSEGIGRATDGEKPVDNPVFYGRLAQRMIHLLSTRTGAGLLYEIDTRLRPSGASGLMVSNLDAFGDYQRSQAWTWEHQALVRARVVAGDQGIAEGFDAIRREILCRPRDRDQLRGEVCEMREKMRGHLSKGGDGKFDLKQDRGGIADIEFMVQYGVLGWASDHPDLVVYTDNIRILDALAAAEVIATDEAALLADAYRAYRAQAHKLALQELPAVVDESEFSEMRQQVTTCWQALMEVD